MGISFDSRPPCALRRLGLRCLYTRLMPSTLTLFLDGSTWSTRPVRRALAVPASSPVMTSTISSLRMCMTPSERCRSHDLGGQADDFQETALAQLAGDGAKDTRAARVLVFLVEQHQGVAVEADVIAVVAARRLLDADDHPLDDLARLDLAARDGLLDAGDDDVAQAGVAAPGAAEHLDAHAL